MAAMKPDACCTPGVHDPKKTAQQATFDRLRLIKQATGGHLSHFTPEEEMAAEMTDNGGQPEDNPS